MKSKKMLALVLAITFFSVKLSIAQNYQKNVIPPDPVSAQFQKYLGYPVSYATGLPEINIPLYTMEASGVSIPFSLSYHASGIGVKQPTGLIGLGWSLFPGFKITRTIMGNPDDISPTNDIRFASQTDFNYLWDITPHNPQDENYAGIPQHDGQYDIFSVHLPNLNATFILEWVAGQLKATTISQSSLDIRVTGLNAQGQFVSFEITDENGVVYKFGSSSESLEFTASYITGWMLTEIDPPGSNNSARFFYQESSQNVTINIDESLLLDDLMNSGPSNSDYSDMLMGHWGTNGPLEGGFYEGGNIADFYRTKTVNRIEFDTGESIVFHYSVNWIYDVLDKITFKNYEGNEVKTIQFERANQQLTKLLVSGENAYEFYYDQQVIDNPQAQDFLGLYNGKSNSTLLPKMVYNFKHPQIIGSGGSSDFIAGYADRSFDPVKSQARILKNIIYPTGGQTSFEYEPNSYETDEGVSCGMGLRIKQINTFDPISNKTMVKSYKYGQNESGVGHLTMDFLKQKDGFTNAYLKERLFVNLKYISLDTKTQSFRERIISSQSNYSSFEPNVWYDEVIEYNNNEGKTVFNYEYTSTYYNRFDFTPFPYNITFMGTMNTQEYFPLILRGLGVAPKMIYKTVKDNNDNVLERTEYQYSNDKRQLKGLMSIATKYFFNADARKVPYYTTIPQYNDDFMRNSIFSVFDYWLEINNDKLITTIQTNYNQGNPITTETSFVYDDTNKFNLKSKSVKTSTGDVLTEKYYYPVGDAIPDLGTMTNAQQAMVGTLASSNYRTAVLEKETLKNNVSISKELFGYKNWGNSILKPEQIYAKKEGNNFDSRYFYYGYDDRGNVLEVSKSNDSHTFYVWGYNKRYPVAKLDNLESSQITPAIQTAIDAVVNASNADHDRTTGTIGQEGALRSALATLRGLLPNSMVTALTYDPLIGVTSTTDPKGNTNYYDYDSYNKLIAIKNSEGKYLTDYKYNYVPVGTYSPIAVPAYSGDLYCGGGRTYIERPTYSVDNEYLSFGDAPVGSSSFLNFNITNTTPLMYQTRYININSINLPSGFSLVSGLPVSLDRGEFTTVTVAFNPDAVTTYGGAATINAEAASLEYIEATGPHINFSGTGVSGSTNSKIVDIRYNGSPISSLDFGTVSGYNESTKTIQIYNTGNTALNVTSIVSSDFSQFTLAGEYCFCPFAIAPGAYKNFDVIFHGIGGSDSGSRAGTITINSDRTGGNNILSVSGTLAP